MSATRPDPSVVLDGAVVRLRALQEADLPELHRAIGRPEVFAGGWGGGAAAYRSAFDEWADFLRAYLPFGAANVYAVCLREDSDRVVGTTTLGDFDLPNESAHIGWTAYSPDVWGTGVNPDAKRMLLGTAFGAGFGRIRIQADGANARSRAAIERLGARFEGLLRRDRLRADGTWRDTAVYSILRDEWPEVEQGLRERLARLGARIPPAS